MKKCVCMLGVFALCVPALAQTTLSVRVVSTGDVDTVSATGSPLSVPVMIQALLGGTPTDGLALLGVNLTDAGIGGTNLCDTNSFLVTASTSPVDIQASFDRNGGLTNPPGLGDPFITGFSGTCDGSGGLLQIGGGQNTIGNSGPTAYPVGTVISQVGNTTWVTIASGTIELTGAETEDIILALNTAFANTLDDELQAPGPFDVTEVAMGNIDLSGMLTIQMTPPLPDCVDSDVNCDGTTNAGDLLVVRGGANWEQTAGSAAEPRSDVNSDGTVNAADLLVIRGGAVWDTSTGPCVCP